MQKAWGTHSTSQNEESSPKYVPSLERASSVESGDGEILTPAAPPPSPRLSSPADAAFPVSKSPVPFLVSAVPVSIVPPSAVCLSGVTAARGGGGGVLPYLGYMGTCRWTGYGFWPRCPKQGIQFDLPLS